MQPTIKPNENVLKDTPTIYLVGLNWPIPMLGPAQNRTVVPAITRVLPTIAKFVESKKTGIIPTISTEQMDDAIEAIYRALTRAHPSLKLSEFIEWDLPAPEMFTALAVVAMQTGIFKPRPKDANTPGEASAETAE